MKNLLRRHRFHLIAIASVCAFLVAEQVEGRAGGGGGFSGGGSSGGGGGDGDGIGILIYFLIRFAIQYPVIGIPLIIVVAVVLLVGAGKGHSAHVSRGIRKTYRERDGRNLTLGKRRLKLKDPKFDGTAFIERTTKAFGMIQDAWAGQDMKPVRHLVSDGVFERFSIQFEIQKGSMLKNVMKEVRILNAELAGIASDEFFDAIQVRITASAIDYYVRTDNQKRVAGSESPEPFTEYWSFLRKPGAKTLEKPGLVDGFCPDCGAPLAMADSAECPSCRAIVNSGEYDWVLAEITQESEWGQKIKPDVPGLERMTRKDPGFNVQHVEDKASVMFHRHVAAGFFAKPDYLMKMACPEFIEKNQGRFKPDHKGNHLFHADAAVGCVELVEITHAALSGEDAFDTARLKVKWAGHKVSAPVPSLIKPDVGSNRIMVNDFILKRKAGVASSTKNVLTSSHCPGCGAPETINTNGACDYCRLPLNDGRADWVLCEIRKFSGYPRRESPYHALEHSPERLRGDDAPSLSRFDRENIIACATAILLADGEVDEKEKELLMRMASEKGIDEERLQIIVNTVQDGGLQAPAPESPAAAKEFLRVMVAMCLADGKISSAEMNLLKKLAVGMNYAGVDIQQMIRTERRRLRRQTKDYLYKA